MKRYSNHDYFDTSKPINRPLKDEQKAGGFRCSHCKQWAVINEFMGTANRNHCNICLWSKHVDHKKGDRMAECRGGMRPVALTFKHEGLNRVGEIMLVHICCSCNKISINRIAGDDDNMLILEIFDQSMALDASLRSDITRQGIYLLQQTDKGELHRQLFGSYSTS
ncbi:MAG TPA: RNHCP domain-containing protein [Candidatus Saccharimonadales bacterium]|nr:RNHCP domain-containing protein [Candidatus Saccharimonadales bacterium]